MLIRSTFSGTISTTPQLTYQAYFHLYLSPQSFLSVRNLPSASPSHLHSCGLSKRYSVIGYRKRGNATIFLSPSLFIFPYIDPSLPRTVFTVLNKILISSAGVHSFIYFVSSLTTSSKSVISLRPLTCHMPVMPGFIASLAR